MSEKLLEAYKITFGYEPGNILLNNFSFVLNKGDFLGLIGPSGAGKTTIARLLSGYEKPFSGEIYFEDNEIGTLYSKERAGKIAVVPQDVFSPMPYSVEEIVEMGRISKVSKFSLLSEKDRNIVKEALELVKLEDFSNKLFNKLSGGEKRRVMIATAIAQEPEVLILDEPTASLDIGLSSHLMKILKGLNLNKDITVIIISHDIQLAAEYCNNLMLLKDGSIISYGSVDEIIKTELINQVFECNSEVIQHKGRYFIAASY